MTNTEPAANHGWTITKEAEYGGLMVIRRPDGTKYGTTQTEAAAKIMRRRAYVDSIPRLNLAGVF